MDIQNYDLFIIGGGINGTAIARDAAGRGLSVYLCEQYDLSEQTSSRSSKMIHGGLRYLEYNEFNLVRKALEERDVMLNTAPHLVQPLQLIIPHNELQRPAWMIHIGLFLYDHLGLRFFRRTHIPKSSAVSFKKSSLFSEPLKSNLTRGFSYYDCKVDDARLVVSNALDAARHHAIIKTHTKLIKAIRENDAWLCTLQDGSVIKARALINAAGPWVTEVVHDKLHLSTQHKMELVKGSHIVIPKFYEGAHAYLLQNNDKRVIFVIPYHDDFTMIGTTDLVYEGAPESVSVSQEEREYLCNVVNQYFKKNISPKDIVNEWSGVRPLLSDDKDNPSAVTRDYKLEVDDVDHKAPLLSIFGGKITTARELAEEAMRLLKLYFPHMKDNWTADVALPGGDMPNADLTTFTQKLYTDFAFLPETLLNRYAHTYGTLTYTLLAGVKSRADLGALHCADLYQKEIDYCYEHEWAHSMEDILWRRTKVGLKLINA